ncbi:tyrosine-type recombinase/integrase [Cupriavidus basilensis]|uniref:tyrosine-type recombinase/integrase n=1 Tax=Cupriavidus basilensis TaxID=68895 RepID=UPI0020C62D12|nr:site-specific integrase [Cupriavidus basilensis]
MSSLIFRYWWRNNNMQGSMLFEDVVGIYLAGSNHRSKQRDAYSLQRLQPYFGGRSVTELRRADVRSYIARRQADGVKQSTIGRELRFFSAALNFVRLEHDRPDIGNPVQRLGLEASEGRVRWITQEEAGRLVLAADLHARWPHLPCFIRLALNTGARKSELLKLTWSRVDRHRRLFLLESGDTKSGKRRSVPLNDAALDALAVLSGWGHKHAPGNPWVFGRDGGRRIVTFQTGFAAACERAGIDDYRIHDMRHTCASWLVMAGVPLMVVKDLLGHSSVTVTERYAHLAPDQIQSAVQRLLPF